MKKLTNHLIRLYKLLFVPPKYQLGQIVIMSEDKALHTIIDYSMSAQHNYYVYLVEGVGSLMEDEIDAYINEYGDLGVFNDL